VKGIPDTSADDLISIELETWIDAARRGDREALGQALAKAQDYLLLVAGDRLSPELKAKGDPSDLVQETFLRAQRGIDGFRGRTDGEWRHWLRMILVRTLAKENRRFAATAKRSVEREVTIPDGCPSDCAKSDETPSRELVRREGDTALIEILERLPGHYRDVVNWHHGERLTFREIGRRRGISAEAARKLWTRALARLRKELGPADD
jgi:RNA polymerase sigma-70 factor (ECF subfamily)